jgi:uncharacterized protein YndB with AHSA1/START domain
MAENSNETFVVERTGTINASNAAVYEQVANFRHWQAWSPWEGIDPSLQRTYSGAESGVGAKYAWVGSRKVGQGAMEITAVEPDRLVRIRLDFIKPFKATNDTVIRCDPHGDSTMVTWTMTGKKTFISKLMGIFMSMDKMVGKDFEKGLAQLKATVESKSAS